jgi:predicted Rossmann fold nucleotide-binding protein DprA/Smf involved in DNA uptake
MLAKAIETQQGTLECPTALHSIFDKKATRLWYVGEPSILNGRLLGIVSARKIEPDLALKTSELVKELSSLEDIAFISGWHSPLEEEVLRILLTRPARIVFCLPKSLGRFTPSAEVKDLITQGQGLLLTHCSPNAKRISRDASLRRNQLVVALAKGLLVLSAPPGSASLKLAHLAINRGRPVFTPQHRINDALLSSGALPATIENIQRVFE